VRTTKKEEDVVPEGKSKKKKKKKDKPAAMSLDQFSKMADKFNHSSRSKLQEDSGMY